MNNKLEALRKEYKQRFNYSAFTWNGDNATGVKFAKKKQREVADFFLSRFATIMDEVVESIVPEEKAETAVLFTRDLIPMTSTQIELEKNKGFNSAIATIKNNYKVIKQ